MFYCSYLNIDCDWSCSAETDDRVIEKVAEHALSEHGVANITEAMKDKIRSAIRDVGSP